MPHPAALLLALILTACQTTAPSTSPALARLDDYVAATARNAEDARDYATAAQQYAALRDGQPGNVEATLGLSRNLRALGRTDTALTAIDETLKETGPRADLLLERGRVLLASGQAERALPPLKEAAGMAPQDWRVAETLGIAYDRLERWDEAAAAYRRALELSPGNPVVLNDLGLSRAMAGDLEEGLRLLRQAAAQPTDRPGVRETVRENIRFLEELRRTGKGG
ncbi:tetratricopeptide repeat protein [Azospirillum sp.]|uniref:tetratricopeptide repeat protein n=1 Tax=Azospirillum sp. TaxID=34012 RepID=UPI002D2E1F1D|nr:tetratricopeptide repeat protein [Azospirillum sp.]HYD69883.1 tetratricopeptide repeat protein [Azospirillum sp.]